MRNSTIIALFFLGLTSSCHSGKEIPAEAALTPETDTSSVAISEESDAAVSIQLNYTGIVRDMRKNEGCGWMIELDLGNGQKQLLEPLTLDEAYQVDGKTIEFAYTDSRRPSQCSLPSKPITIDQIIK